MDDLKVIDSAEGTFDDATGGVVVDEPKPEAPPFQIAHLDIAGVLATVKAIHPFCAGRPATLEVVGEALRGAQGVPDGVTDQIALDCMLWAISIRKQHMQERANHLKTGAAIGYAKHLVQHRFQLVGKRLKGGRKGMWRPSRKSSQARS